VLGSAHTLFNDYIGTVAADDAVALTGEPSLYELASIDRDLYTIVAVDLLVEGPVTATVYAVDGFHKGSDHTATLRSWGRRRRDTCRGLRSS